MLGTLYRKDDPNGRPVFMRAFGQTSLTEAQAQLLAENSQPVVTSDGEGFYYLMSGGDAIGLFVPRGTNLSWVACLIRRGLGDSACLHFPEFPRDHEVHLLPKPASELSALAKA